MSKLRQLWLSEIKSGQIRDAIRRGLGGKEYALPPLRCVMGRILVQGQVRARLIIASVGFQSPAQMCLAQDNDVIQTLTPDRSDQPLGKAVPKDHQLHSIRSITYSASA
jgi:hypothetical protein